MWQFSSRAVDAGEDYEEAAKRELQEELGISGATLQKVSVYSTNNIFNGRKLNRFNTLYKATISSSTPLKLQEGEVSETRWFTLDEAKKFVAEQPHNITDGLAQVITDYY